MALIFQLKPLRTITLTILTESHSIRSLYIDSECCIIDIFAGWPGRAHNARVFSRSKIGQKVINGTVVAGTTR